MMTTAVIPYRMFNNIDNLGDAINPAIIHACSGLEPVLARAGAHLLGIGSILQLADRDSHVWGSGVMWPDSDAPRIDPARVFAVRGVRTRDHLHRLGLLARDVPLGDPGFLGSETAGWTTPCGQRGPDWRSAAPCPNRQCGICRVSRQWRNPADRCAHAIVRPGTANAGL